MSVILKHETNEKIQTVFFAKGLTMKWSFAKYSLYFCRSVGFSFILAFSLFWDIWALTDIWKTYYNQAN